MTIIRLNIQKLRDKDIDKNMLILQSTVNYMLLFSNEEQKVMEGLKWIKELLSVALSVADLRK
jgi:hypothetical protein